MNRSEQLRSTIQRLMTEHERSLAILANYEQGMASIINTGHATDDKIEYERTTTEYAGPDTKARNGV